VMAAFGRDPFGTAADLSAKRRKRNPFFRRHPYSVSCPEIAGLLNHRTRNGKTYGGILPWNV
jgi:hypothetical protein